MTNQENIADTGQGPTPDSTQGAAPEYQAGQRSITQRATKSRFEMLREKQEKDARGRPFIYGGLALLVVLMAVIGVAYWNVFVAPPRALAIRVGDVEYSRGDVVDLIRFNQRLSEEIGVPFQLGNSVFETLQTIQDAELAFQVAPQYGVAVSPDEVNDRIEFILGFALTEDEVNSPEYEANIEETKRQFLNRVGLPESVWRDFLKKVLFQERLREVVGDSIDRIQPQVHLYEIQLLQNDPQVVTAIQRSLASGREIGDVAVEFSEDFEVARTRGEIGWLPQGVVSGQVDSLMFGVDQDGNRILPFKTPSTPTFNSESGRWSVLIVDEYQEAREVDDESLEVLKDTAMTIFLNEQRKTIDLYLDLNSEIANWVNKQVKINSLAATPAPSQADGLQGLLPGGGGIPGAAPTPVTPPRGIPGISRPIQ